MIDAPRTARGAAAEIIRQTARSEFDRWADSYDRSWLNEFVFFPSIRACQEEILRWQIARGGKAFDLLDVGCGTGSLLTILSDDPRAMRLVGLDYSQQMLRHFSEKIARAPHGEKLSAVHGDSERLPFADASFDVVTCCNSFHHYPHQALVLKSFRRVLRPGGLLVLIDGFRDNVVGWVLFDVFVAGIEKNVHHAPWRDIRRMLDEAGFTGVRQRKMNVLAPLLVSTARVMP